MIRSPFLTCAILLLFPLSSSAAEVAWKMHTINAQSEFPACAAFDVDHDGDIDIYSGGWWYEAPEWKKHKVRDVEVIRGRFDDYSNQPMDCNGDGWTDIISVNYRSETIYWIEHPGKSLGQQDWTAHVIDKPGPSETGRLHDIDGDGDLDILPNGTTYAAWYEFKPEKKDGRLLEPKWVKHDLPKELAGHGIGVSFTNVTPLIIGKKAAIGWEHRDRGESWSKEQIPSEYLQDIHSDASVPILTLEVLVGYFLKEEKNKKQDRHIWGRGHSTGIYSLHHVPLINGNVHLLDIIDTSWSQCHAPMQADIDNDGAIDLVAGKRYMGHEGKDLGEYEPLAIYWYRFDKEKEGWRRYVIHEMGPAGIDLDGKVIDIDADGDVDIVTPSRHGLFLFENLLVNKKEVAATTFNQQKAIASYDDHSKLLVYATREGDRRPVKSPHEWGIRRWHILRNMEAVMGPLPSTRIEFEESENWKKHRPNYVVDSKEKYDVRRTVLESGVVVTILTPKGARWEKKLPAMLCLHPTSIPHGKKIVTGEVEAKNRNYAHELAERGYVCICPDYPTMGENPFDLKATHKHYQSGTMKAIWDNIRCLDELESLPEVNPDRIGVIGHSLGGHNGLFTACFDQRIKCVVTSCGFTPFHDYYGGKLAGWTQDRYMPRIRDVYESNPDKMPFDFYEVLGACAPRGLFINAPLHDDNFDVGGVKKCVAEVQKVYDLLGKPDALQVRYPDCAHDFPEDVRKEAYEWLDKQLK